MTAQRRERSELQAADGPVRAARKALISGAAADMEARDPEFIRSQLPIMWLLATIYFRAEVRGFDRVPDDGPVLFVGNHSGGNMTPDSLVFMLGFNTYFGVERPVYALAHAMVTQAPLVGRIGRKWGIVTADPTIAKAALRRGSSVLVYPGGDVETHRPWRARNEIRFDGRKGFVKLAAEAGVPIVPVVSCGGQETFLPLTDGRRLAKRLRLAQLGRLKILPVSLALPWGLNVGDMLGHIPFPAKITQEILEPIDVRDRFGSPPDTDEAYEYVTSRMQETLTALAAERVLPPFL
jgi:1-acyl-sn-glycerol-3-phosphate acyltransferase